MMANMFTGQLLAEFESFLKTLPEVLSNLNRA